MGEIQINIMLSFLIVLAIGFFAKKANILGDDFESAMPVYLSKITLPCFAFTTILSKDVNLAAYSDSINFAIFSFVSIGIIFLFGFGVAFRLKTEEKGHYPIIACGVATSNVFTISAPILLALYGIEGMYYSVIFYIVQDISLWSYGVYSIRAMSPNKEGHYSPLKSFFNPSMIAIIIAFIFKGLNITPQPIIMEITTALSTALKELSLIYMGVLLGSMSFKELFLNLNVWKLAFIKMLALPTVFAIVLLFVYPFGLSTIAIKVLLITMGVAPMMTLAVVSKAYGGDAKLTTTMVIALTLISAFTIPMLTTLIEAFANY